MKKGSHEFEGEGRGIWEDLERGREKEKYYN